MKIKSKSNTGKKTALAAVVLTILAVAVGAYVLLNKSNQPPVQKPHVDLSPATSDQIKAGNEIKKQSIEQATKPNVGSDSAQSSSTPLATQITAASVEGDTLYIRNDISGIYETGTCTLTLTKDGTVVTKTAGVQALPQSSTCKGFNVKTSELSSGNWTIKIFVTIEGQTATATGSVKV
jgi:hypothetical protein